MEIKIPAVGESVFEALVARWMKSEGERVGKDEPLCEIETDKITFEISSEAAGMLHIATASGTTVPVGAVIGTIDEASVVDSVSHETTTAPVPLSPPLSPSVKKIAQEHGIEPSALAGSGRGGRVTVDDLFARMQTPRVSEPLSSPAVVRSEEEVPYGSRDSRITRQAMSPIRRRIADRLVAARQQTAMLTTFNEADLSRVLDLRDRHREEFQRKHGVTLGFMPFFVKACAAALKEFPAVNARIDGNDIVYQHFYDIGIAVSGPKGLVVPVLRNADRLHFAEIETTIAGFVTRIEEHTLTLAELEGGTFSISNGGVFGSLLSTPIINPPQCGVLGMHAIQQRPVARDGTVVIRPMMYLALSYDHRLIDGREAVQFLKLVREYVEDPEEMLLEG